MEKRQIVMIHGGDSFNSYESYLKALKQAEFDPEGHKKERWHNNLEQELEDDFDFIKPRMPNTNNAEYNEWRIWFEKTIPFLRDGVVLMGHSLGGVFLAKYLSENDFPIKIRATYLIAAPYDDDSAEDLGSFKLTGSLDKLREQGGQIFLYHSQDDPVVPFVEVEKYAAALPEAEKLIFKDREHFNQATFPELSESLKKLL